MKKTPIFLIVLLIMISGCISTNQTNQIKKITVLSKSTGYSSDASNQFHITDINGTTYEVTESIYLFVEPGKTYYFQYDPATKKNISGESAKIFTEVITGSSMWGG